MFAPTSLIDHNKTVQVINKHLDAESPKIMSPHVDYSLTNITSLSNLSSNENFDGLSALTSLIDHNKTIQIIKGHSDVESPKITNLLVVYDL